MPICLDDDNRPLAQPLCNRHNSREDESADDTFERRAPAFRLNLPFVGLTVALKVGSSHVQRLGESKVEAFARQPVGEGAGESFSDALFPYLDQLLRLITARVSPSLTEDVLQDTLLRAFRSWHRFDTERPVWPWLASIAERACATAWKADLRWQRDQGAETAVAASSDPTPGSDQHVASLHARAVVLATLAELTERERLLVFRSDAEDVPRHLLAREVTLSPGAVRVALHRARLRFRDCASRRWDDFGVSAALLIGRFRLRWNSVGGVMPIGALAISASVVLTLAASTALRANVTEGVVGALAGHAHPHELIAKQGLPVAEPGSEAVSTAGASAAREGDLSPHDDREARRPLLRPEADATVSGEGLRGGVRMDWTLPNDGHVAANPSVRCRQSTVTGAMCTATGALPSTGPVSFYGSGDGNP